MARQRPTVGGTRTPSTNLALDELPPQTTPLDGFTFQLRQTSSVRALNSAVGVTAMTGADIVDADQAASQGDTTGVDMALSRAEQNMATWDQLEAQGVDPMQAAQVLTDDAQKAQDQQEFRDFVLNGALTVGNPNYSPAMARVQTNQQIMMEALEAKFAETETQGFGATTTDFLDRYVLRYLAFGMWEDLTRRSERRGADVMSAMASMSPAEFQEYADAYAQDLSNEGVFKGTNWFALQEGLNEVTNAGYDPAATAVQIFALLDVIPLTVGATRAVGTLGRTAAIRGASETLPAVENLVKGGAHRVGPVQDELLPGHMSVTRDPDYRVGAPEGRAQRILQNNDLVPKIQNLYSQGAFGRVATKEEIDAAAGRIVDEVEKFSDRPLVATSAGDLTGFGDYGVSILVGKIDNGDPIMDGARAAEIAQDYAQRGGFATEVIEAVPGDPSKGFYVEILENVPTAGLADAADISQVTENILAKTFGSARTVDLEVNSTLAQMGESGFVRFTETVKPYVDKIDGLSFEGKQTMDSIWRQLRDGKDSYLRTHYTESEFRQEWITRTNRAPTEAEVEAYYAIQTISDAAWIMQANRMATRYVERGFKSIQISPNHSVPARIWGGSTENIRIKNLENGFEMKARDLPEGAQIWKLDRPWSDGTEYVTNPTNVRAVQYEDVMPYNAGGRRIYDANYFGTIGDRAIITAYSAKQAESFVAEFANIQKALRSTGRKLSELTDELDDVISKNNAWNKSITNTADLKRIAAKRGWDLEQEVSYKASGAKIEGQSEDLFNGLSAKEYYTLTQRRSDDVLMNYGGGTATDYSPIKAIVGQLSDTGSEYAYRAYNFRAKTAWLKKALGADRLPKGADINQLFRDTVVKGDGPTQRKLRNLKAVIERREQVRGPVMQALHDFGQRMSEWIFDTVGLKVGFGGLEGTMLGMGFQSAFGFFNLSQFFLQATHAATIAMISPKHGSRAASLVLPLRLAKHMPDGAARKLATERLAKAAGITVDELDEFWEYLARSGRDNIEQDALEKGTGAGFGVSYWEGRSMLPSVVNKGIDAIGRVGKRGLQLGTLPFNEGERLSRHTGILTAFLEFKAKHPGVSALSDQGRSWIVRREQDLGFNMTTVSRGAFQSGVFKIPTQWLSYSMRYMESIVIGRGFTPAERLRLGLSMGMMGGVAGLGFASAADYLGEKLGLDPEGNAFVGLKYGLVDALFSEALQGVTGNEDLRTAFGTRIAPLTAFTDLYRKVTEESAWSAVAGPSGEIVGGGVSALLSTVGAIFDGNFQMARADIERVIRTPSAIDNYWKMISMANYGLYQSKTGTTIPMDFSIDEAVMQGVGITNFRIAEYYQRRTEAFRDAKDFRETSKQMTTDFRRALEMVERGEEEAGYSLMREVEYEIQTSGYSPFDQQRLRRALRADTSNDVTVLLIDMIARENEYGARVLEGIK